MSSTVEILNLNYLDALLFDITGSMTFRADMAFADPPYNQGIQYQDDDSKDKRSNRDYLRMITASVLTAAGLCNDGACLWWVCPEGWERDISRLLTCHFGPRVHRVIWWETFSQYNRFNLTQDYRFLLCHQLQRQPKVPNMRRMYQRKLTANLNNIRIPSRRMELGDKRAAGPRIPGKVWQFRRLQGTALDRVDWHPAQMPPELLERLLLGWTAPGQGVVDLFAGSGTMGIQAIRHHRNFLGIDSSRTYCQLMLERLKEEGKDHDSTCVQIQS